LNPGKPCSKLFSTLDGEEAVMKYDKEKTKNECERFTIRKMEMNDVEDILPISATAVLNPWSKNMFLEELAQPSSHCFLLSHNSDAPKDIPLGFICFRTLGEESELLNLAIAPHHRQKGLAKKLVQFYIDFCHERGVKQFYLEVNPQNLPALRLYQSFAYKVAGKRKKFYQGQYDALLMER
jgi:ribosomal-protein-alanine N-acetyltransferase